MQQPNNLTIKNSVKGQAVYALRVIKKDEKILDFKGKKYTLQTAPSDFNEENNHYLQIGLNLWLGPSGEIDDLINHSCNPNATVIIDEEHQSAYLKAVKEIQPGEEINFDYAVATDDDTWKLICLCGEPNCRGIVTDFKRLPKDRKDYYIKLGIVPKYILKIVAELQTESST